AIAKAFGAAQHDDYNAFEGPFDKALKQAKVTLAGKEKKQLLAAVSWTTPEAAPVLKMVLKTKAEPLYGAFLDEKPGAKAQVLTLQPDSSLRDNEDVPLTADTARGAKVNAENEAYFKREVAPHVKDAWI